MREVKFLCDRCGVEIAEDRSGLTVMGGNPPRHLVGRRVDFCEPCAELFRVFCGELKGCRTTVVDRDEEG